MILLLLVLLVARADAAPADAPTDDDALALAIRYANALTGDDFDDPPDQAAAPRSSREDGEDDDDDDDDDDRDDADDEPIAAGEPVLDDAGALALRETGELGDADATLLTSDELGFAATQVGAAERYEARLRRRRTSLLGRLDLSLAWRRHASAPRHAAAHADHELWLLATWRR